jgi:hypothetical protein
MSDDKCLLTPDQAIAMLDPDGENIHTLRSAPLCMLGADWERSDLIKAIRTAAGLEIGGDMCKGMNHGLVVWTERDNPLFVECAKGFDYDAYEHSIKAQVATGAQP